MKKLGYVAVVVLVMGLLGAGGAQAQVTQSQTVTVQATNQGIFTFAVSPASFNFGNVDASGSAIAGMGAGVTAGGRTGANDGGTYSATSALSWVCNSAPVRTTKIYNASSTVTGVLAGDRLEMRIPAAGGGTSSGFKKFTSQSGTPAGDLITSMTVGNGGNAVNGNTDFRLTVLDADTNGATSWTVVLTASGI
jgi:hypothetical protein